MPNQVKIFDTTLRDGEQSPGCSMNLAEKIEVARALETLGVDIIEAGFAVSSPGDFESVKTIAESVRNCTVASLCRCLEKDIDASVQALVNAANPRLHVFLATSDVHMKYKLRMTPEQVLERTDKMVRYARRFCEDVEFSAEDATRSDRAFLAKVVEIAINAGATTVNIPDTVGYTTPMEMRELIAYLRETVPDCDRAILSLHCHDDLGMAVANSVAGVKAGARQIECTVNGIGERAGNAALEEVVMALRTRADFYDAVTGIDTTKIYRTSRLLSNIIGQSIPRNKAVVGKNAFAHESGIHQHGVLAEKTTYEIMTPESIGVPKNSLVLGKHSGRHAFEQRLSELGYKIEPAELDKFFAKFKDLADKKKELTDGDLEAIVQSREYVENLFTLDTFAVNTGNGIRSSCALRLKKGEELLEDVSLGDGPVDAAFNAIDKITGIACQDGEKPELESYTIHSATDGKDALGEVVVKLRCRSAAKAKAEDEESDRLDLSSNTGEDDGVLVTGRGLSTDIIESSILAYLNAVNKLMSFK
ncbi:MAG: 2-isopropylmalate synthase [Oscillospiraceae bacterium]|jgi:2-isopropylmalate synthase|nr:2-isopropylmalate synthase [Oscillospiraceae bacterium]